MNKEAGKLFQLSMKIISFPTKSGLSVFLILEKRVSNYLIENCLRKVSLKLLIDIRWFKEKRNCGGTLANYKSVKLESFCTYCNKRFNHEEPIPCNHVNCYSTFCSRHCMNDHIMLLHKNKA